MYDEYGGQPVTADTTGTAAVEAAPGGARPGGRTPGAGASRKGLDVQGRRRPRGFEEEDDLDVPRLLKEREGEPSRNMAEQNGRRRGDGGGARSRRDTLVAVTKNVSRSDVGGAGCRDDAWGETATRRRERPRRGAVAARLARSRHLLGSADQHGAQVARYADLVANHDRGAGSGWWGDRAGGSRRRRELT